MRNVFVRHVLTCTDFKADMRTTILVDQGRTKECRSRMCGVVIIVVVIGDASFKSCTCAVRGINV